MNKRRWITAGVFLLALVAAVFTAVLCNGMKKKGSSDGKGSVIDEADIKVIRYAVPSDLYRLPEKNLKAFNEELLKDGKPYRLEVKELGPCILSDEYQETLEKQLKSGEIDVAYMGLSSETGENWVYDLIHAGLVLNLEDILTGDRGKVIYDAFPKELWEAVKCDKHIYSIPAGLTTADQGVFAAFNRDYISDADIEAWDGTIDGIYEIIKKVDWEDSENPRFHYLIDLFEFDEMLGCEIDYGLLFDYETLTVENPLESEKVMHFLKVLDQMKKDGFLGLNVAYTQENDYDPDKYNQEVWDRIADGKFLVALSADYVEEEFRKPNITVKRIHPYLTSKVRGSVAISKQAADVNAVVDFLSLLYGEEKYANILLYGREGTDYKTVDGVAYNMDGSELEPEIFDKMLLNLTVNVYPGSGEKTLINRKEELFAFYKNVAKSPFLGFEPDTAKLGGISETMKEFIIAALGKDTSLDETAAAAADKLKADAIDDYLRSVRSQWEDFRK